MRSLPFPFLIAVIVIGCAAPIVPKVASYQPSTESLVLKTCRALPKNQVLPRFARLMHDSQWMEWPSRMASPTWPNGFHFDWYPETVPLWRSPRGGDGRFAYDLEWLQFLRALQPNDDAAVWIARVAAGLFNKGNPFIPILNLDGLETKPVAESISSGGNVVRILQVRNGSGRLEMLHLEDGPPTLDEVNYSIAPWMITKFTSVSIDGELGNAGGIDVFFPNVAKRSKGYWVDLERVEWFPQLPLCVAIQEEVKVYAAPSFAAAITETMSVGRQVMVSAYLPQASDVWGKIDGGWIPLEYLVDGQPVYPTTWEMETRPQIVFD